MKNKMEKQEHEYNIKLNKNKIKTKLKIYKIYINYIHQQYTKQFKKKLQDFILFFFFFISLNVLRL